MDRDRAAKRSTFALEQVIDHGLDGTAMASFARLPVQDRWDLAFPVGTFAYPATDAATGEKIWNKDVALRAKIPDLAALAAMTPKALAKDIGVEKANAVIAYLRSNPAAVQSQSNAGGLDLTRTRLAESLAAYRAGNRDEAKRLALSAYLDGFEPVEPCSADVGWPGRAHNSSASNSSSASSTSTPRYLTVLSSSVWPNRS